MSELARATVAETPGRNVGEPGVFAADCACRHKAVERSRLVRRGRRLTQIRMKGAAVFARISVELGRRRPDIPAKRRLGWL